MPTQLQVRKDELEDVLADEELSQDAELIQDLLQQIEYLEFYGDEQATQELYIGHGRPSRHPMQGAADALEARITWENEAAQRGDS